MLPIIFEIIIFGTRHLGDQYPNTIFREIKKNKAEALKKYTAALHERLNSLEKEESNLA